MDETKLKASFNRHRSEPDVSIDEYVRARRIDLGKSATQHKLIYLDQRYWIILRNVVLGRHTDAESIRLLDALRLRVSNKQVICPISDTVFVELLKQEDLHTRRETAALIDELSLGLTLAPEQERVGTELAHFLHSHDHQIATYPLKWLVWSKLSFVLGILHPTRTAFGPEQELVLQKAFFDHMWGCSLVKVVETLGGTPPPRFDFDKLATQLNLGNAAHANATRSFDQAYMHEIEGGLSLYMPTARQILENMYVRASGVAPETIEADQKDHERQLFSFFAQCFKLKKSEMAKCLPTLHVHALCHAAVRWNKKQCLEGNDLYDFHHATAAVPYCDVFLTEKPLRSLLQANHLKIKRDFSCEVISSISEAAEYVEAAW